MGTVIAESIIDIVAGQLRDNGFDQWSQNDLLTWVNAGQRQIAMVKPDAHVVSVEIQLVEGTRQQLPVDAVSLIDIPRNMGTDGNTPGTAIRYAKKRDFDLERPGWHSDSPSAVVKHYMFNQKHPSDFWVWPPQPSSSQGYVEVEYSAVPTDVAIDDPIALSDIYVDALIDYAQYRAYQKESKSPVNRARASEHYSAFMQMLGGKDAREASDDPATDQLMKVSEP